MYKKWLLYPKREGTLSVLEMEYIEELKTNASRMPHKACR